MAIRIIGGTAKGRLLKVTTGLKVRPTSDRVRESIFNILGDVTGTQVLDLFAGTGALGIESLSRGASHVVFVEPEREARDVLKGNLISSGFQGKAEIHTAPAPYALEQLAREEKLFDLVFLDPPYHTNLLEACLAELIRQHLLNPGATVVAEHDWRERPWEPSSAEIDRRETRRYGDTAITIYRAGEFVPSRT